MSGEVSFFYSIVQKIFYLCIPSEKGSVRSGNNGAAVQPVRIPACHAGVAEIETLRLFL